MLIGIDFDNTIAGYDSVFTTAAVQAGLIEEHIATSKNQVREALRARPGGEEDWKRLQGRVYGTLMGDAVLIEGVGDFFHRCRHAEVEVCIVSHKTEHGHYDTEQVNLRDAARAWMESNGFFDKANIGLSRDSVFFETTRADKVTRIAEINCTHFIDDLVEVLMHPDFPEQTERFLFAPAGHGDVPDIIKSCSTWDEIGEAMFPPAQPRKGS